MVTPAKNALFVINGKSKMVNCEIGGIDHPVAVIWIHSPTIYSSSNGSGTNGAVAGTRSNGRGDNNRTNENSTVNRGKRLDQDTASISK